VGLVKLSVRLFLYLIEHHALKTYGEWRYSCTHFDGGEWLASRPGTHQREASYTIIKHDTCNAEDDTESTHEAVPREVGGSGVGTSRQMFLFRERFVREGKV
jgi:hypothetical protein